MARLKRHIGLRSEAAAVSGSSLALYLIVAGLLAFKYQVYPEDAISRMANGFYVLYSADPHLAAMGFAWNPLQSICDLLLLLFKDLWSDLATRDVAGSLVSALSMAGAVHQLRSALQEWGIRRVPRLVLTAAFGFAPMILFFAGNGMSEALYLFTLLAATRYLLRWHRDGDLRSLVFSGVALALAYLARNEALGAGLAATALVFATSLCRANGNFKEESFRFRLNIGLIDTTIFVMPLATAVVGWAAASYIVTHQLFPQIQANAVQLRAAGVVFGSVPQRLLHEILATESLAPALPILLGVALVQSARLRDAAALFPLVVLGGAFAFDLVAYMNGALFPWLRFYILAIPLAVLLTGGVCAGFVTGHAPADTRDGHRSGRTRLPLLAGTLGFLVLAPSFVTSPVGMLSSSIGAGETSEYLAPIFSPHDSSGSSDAQLAATQNLSDVQRIDSYLEHMKLGVGEVVVDDLDTCVPNLIVQSTFPQMFMIPNDRAFQRVAADPLIFGAHFILMPPETGIDATGQLAHEYPTLYDTGEGFTSLAHQFPPGGQCPPFRLYSVFGHPGEVGS